MRKTLLLPFFLSSYCTIAQVGIGTTSPDPDSVLEISSADSGLLLPRISLSSTNLSTPLANHVSGMVIYNTTSCGGGSTAVSPGIYYNNGTSWISLGIVTVGDIKYSFSSSDHGGWYLLNGRALISLSTNAQNNAAVLGFSGNLPNATDRFLKANNGSETLGSTGGNSTITISQANLPNVNFTGTTNSGGAHTHTFSDHGDSSINASLLGVGLGAVTAVSSGSYTTDSSGSHSHTATVSSGGSSTPINNEPAHIVTNIFVYLGS